MTFVQFARVLRRLTLATMGLAVVACQFMQPDSATRATALPQLNTANALRYRIDPVLSVIQLKVYRDGLLARLGHNHVITATAIEGTVYRREPLPESGFDLHFPVSALVVDRPADRRRAGSDFPGDLPSAQIEATRTNMLGPQLLQAEQFPVIELRSLGAEGRPPALTWRIAVRVRDRVSELRVPVQIRQSGQQLIAQGAVKLSQAELGLAPFCALAGKLCVRDDIDAEFYLVASPSP